LEEIINKLSNYDFPKNSVAKKILDFAQTKLDQLPK